MEEFEDTVKCADEIDRASVIADTFNKESVAKIQQQVKPEQVQNKDGSWPVTECVDCDQEIPAARLALAKVRCIHCQALLEKRRAGHVGTARVP